MKYIAVSNEMAKELEEKLRYKQNRVWVYLRGRLDKAMDSKEDCVEIETCGSNIGEGIGCLIILVGIGVLFNFGRVLDLIMEVIK